MGAGKLLTLLRFILPLNIFIRALQIMLLYLQDKALEGFLRHCCTTSRR